MASLVKKERSPYWYCAFTDATGRRLKKSTELTSRSKAMQMCMQWQRAADMARQGALTADRAREVISEIVASVHGGDGLRSFTVRQWFEHFVKIKSESQNPKTAAKYEQVSREFVEFLGPKADLNILSITSADVRVWRDGRKSGGKLSATTLNDHITILSAIFNGAWRDHVISNNPCTAVEAVKDAVTPKKRQKHAFTVEQIQALLSKANLDWRGLIKTAFYSSARLDNCANLRWRNIDYQNGKITFERYSKHGDEHEVPLHEALKEHFLSVKTPKSDDAFVFPSLAGRHVPNLSKQFRKLMEAARIKNWKVREGNRGNGRSTARDVWALGFHSFRRTNISLLANADVPEERRMALAAHATREIHRGYTTHEFEQLRKANAVLPKL